MGDLHGNYRALMQVLQRSKFDYENDLLISLGDIADGYSQTPECIEELMKIKNFVWCLGNHDEWVQRWFSGRMDMLGVNKDGEYYNDLVNRDAHLWLSQGGQSTYAAYVRSPKLITKHRHFWIHKPLPYTIYKNICYVHAGFDPNRHIDSYLGMNTNVLWWDRELWDKAIKGRRIEFVDGFERVFIGHTAVTYWDYTAPQERGKITNMDTGAGWRGYLSLMNVDTKEVFQSDSAKLLYPNEKAR